MTRQSFGFLRRKPGNGADAFRRADREIGMLGCFRLRSSSYDDKPPGAHSRGPGFAQ
jgi:hypothetical protein